LGELLHPKELTRVLPGRRRRQTQVGDAKRPEPPDCVESLFVSTFGPTNLVVLRAHAIDRDPDGDVSHFRHHRFDT
jgi:hypothetical protein